MHSELETLQTHIAFQEHTISELNEALVSQQRQLDVFRVELRLLREKLNELEAQNDYKGSAPADEIPPHY